MAFVVGDSVTFTKTVGETDVYLFAGITGDFAPNHVDREYMARTRYGERIAHGVLVLGYASTASSRMLERSGEHAVSYGYDRVRFCGPVFLGVILLVAAFSNEWIRRWARSASKPAIKDTSKGAPTPAGAVAGGGAGA